VSKRKRRSDGEFSPSPPRSGGGGRGEEALFDFVAPQKNIIYAAPVNPTDNARRLRREQTGEEKELWRALRAGRFAGFKFRRQHPLGDYFLDFYCPVAKLSIELDGFQHGLPEQRRHDEEREKFLEAKGIGKLRFWNHQWRANREAVLLEIWNALHRRTSCVAVMRKARNHRFLPPKVSELIQPPPKPD
jgi:very-short-patch-repair endonuclease